MDLGCEGGGSFRLDVTRMLGGNLDATCGRGSVHKISDSPILIRDFEHRACRNNKLRRPSASSQLAGSHVQQKRE
jgi:hypothetical protein